MRRCTSCFRYSVGQPTFCTYCGRSYDVRICSRGHRNPRGAQFCAECGSEDLSTPSDPEGFLSRLSLWALRFGGGTTVTLVIAALLVGALWSIDWSRVAPRLVLLCILLGILYWTTTLLPGPVKRVGRAATRKAWKAVKPNAKRR